MSQDGNNRDYTVGKRSIACAEREISKLKKQRDALLDACKETQKLFAFITENYKSASHYLWYFPAAERMVNAAVIQAEKAEISKHTRIVNDADVAGRLAKGDPGTY